MALDSSIINVLEEQASLFNQNEEKPVKARVNLPKSENPGRGNADSGRHCIYDIIIAPTVSSIRQAHVLQVFHHDGMPYPATIKFSEPVKEVFAVSPDDLRGKVREILESEETKQNVQWLLR